MPTRPFLVLRPAVFAVALLLLASCGSSSSSTTSTVAMIPESIVIADRGAGTLSVIDTTTDTVVKTVALPGATLPTAPGYVVYSAAHDRLYVGDTANHRVIALGGPGFTALPDLLTVADAFHMWAHGSQLWVVDRVDKSLAVFDLDTHTRIAVVPVPPDLVALGGVPHDVVVDITHAFVTVASVSNAPDVVVKYSRTTFAEVARVSVGDDPHAFLHPTSRSLYVACQDTDNVFVIDRDTLGVLTTVPTFGGHGVWIPASGQALYVTNFPGHIVGGDPGPNADGLFTVDLNTNTSLGGTSIGFPAPHNLASTADGSKLYLTHSEGGTRVSVFDLATPTSKPVFRTAVTVGANPFGLARVPAR